MAGESYGICGQKERRALARAHHEEDVELICELGANSIRLAHYQTGKGLWSGRKEQGDVLNWFEITAPEGYFSINDKLGEIMKDKKGARYLKAVIVKAYAKKKLCSWKKGKEKGREAKGHSINLNNPEMKRFFAGMSVKRLLSMAGTMGPQFEFHKEDVLRINRRLNRIRKPEKQ